MEDENAVGAHVRHGGRDDRAPLPADRARSSHTPGPWRIVEDDIHGEDDTHVVCFGHDYEEYGGIHSTADAHLIAAAPDLLDALRSFCGDYEATPTTNDTSLKAAYLHALAVIAKAEGR